MKKTLTSMNASKYLFTEISIQFNSGRGGGGGEDDGSGGGGGYHDC